MLPEAEPMVKKRFGLEVSHLVRYNRFNKNAGIHVRIFKTKEFDRFARKERISDAKLREVIRDAQDGKIDADYGGGVIKQRIARPNQGKSGGYRSIIMYRRGDKAFFVHGFAKSDKANLSKEEERYYKDAAKIVLNYSPAALDAYLARGAYMEIDYHD